MVKYFAYGSCMNENDLHKSEPNAKKVGVGKLNDYRLAFNYFSSSRRSGAANIMEESGSIVEGIIWEVPNLYKIDMREGAPFYYEQLKVKVEDVKTGELIDVTTYKVIPQMEAPWDIDPSEDYMNVISEGAADLSPEYQDELKATSAKFRK